MQNSGSAERERAATTEQQGASRNSVARILTSCTFRTSRSALTFYSLLIPNIMVKVSFSLVNSYKIPVDLPAPLCVTSSRSAGYSRHLGREGVSTYIATLSLSAVAHLTTRHKSPKRYSSRRCSCSSIRPGGWTGRFVRRSASRRQGIPFSHPPSKSFRPHVRLNSTNMGCRCGQS